VHDRQERSGGDQALPRFVPRADRLLGRLRHRLDGRDAGAKYNPGIPGREYGRDGCANRVAWAITHMYQAGLLERPRQTMRRQSRDRRPPRAGRGSSQATPSAAKTSTTTTSQVPPQASSSSSAKCRSSTSSPKIANRQSGSLTRLPGRRGLPARQADHPPCQMRCSRSAGRREASPCHRQPEIPEGYQ
jgi:hypothetical protein